MPEQKYLFVGEYHDSYTGGSVVFISTEEFLKEFEIEKLKIVLDPFENQLRKVRQFPLGLDDNYNGIPLDNFWGRISSGDFTTDFIEYVQKTVEKYDSYFKQIGNIRVDHAFPDCNEGIYIVYKLPVDSEYDEIHIISDTYYCA